jgi:hypothetical protein
MRVADFARLRVADWVTAVGSQALKNKRRHPTT